MIIECENPVNTLLKNKFYNFEVIIINIIIHKNFT